MFDDLTLKLQSHISQLTNIDEWLFVTINTMRAIVDNSSKEDVSVVLKAVACKTTSEIQQMYDRVQGIYGRNGFSYRNSPEYYYLSSLVAGFPDTELSNDDRKKITEFYKVEDYFMYRI